LLTFVAYYTDWRLPHQARLLLPRGSFHRARRPSQLPELRDGPH
jgi:hypothetical protein